jgi:uncharacterized protein YebE (UPF0316 family)
VSLDFSAVSFDLNAHTILTCAGIMAARMTDVTLGTLRTKQVAMGRRMLACTLGFFEVLIWVAAVSTVVANLTNPLFALAYALGHSGGVFIGLTIDRKLALGNQVIRVFTRLGPEMAAALRAEGWRVTEFTGRGRDGPVLLLYCEVPRRQVTRLARRARELDPRCFYIVEDVNTVSASERSMRHSRLGGIRSLFKFK